MKSRRLCLLLCIIMSLMFTACGQIKVPQNASDYIGRNYAEVITELKGAGFSVFENTEIDDLTSKDSMPDGAIESITIDGQADFTTSSKFASNACIAIKYHIIKKLSSPINLDQIMSLDTDSIVSEFKNAGFTNVSTEDVYDLDPDQTDVDHRNEVKIANKTVDNTSDVFPFDGEVLVICHYPFKKYDVKLSVDFDSNILFSKYGVDVIFDGQNVATLAHGEDWESLFNLKKGTYELSFCKSGDSAVCGAVSIEITSNTEAAYKIKCHKSNIDVTNQYFNREADEELNRSQGVVAPENPGENIEAAAVQKEEQPVQEKPKKKQITLSNLPPILFGYASVEAYNGSAYTEVNGNKPYFLDAFNSDSEFDFSTDETELYSELDNLGRCGQACAVIGKERMPTEERGAIGHIKPSGWQTVKYPDLIEDLYLYNRCHLIGYQLGGDDADERNIITGTRYLNMEGMLPFENEVANYVSSTNNHVIYRVTVIFSGDNLVANGVLMEAYSVEDKGSGICYCVYSYNVQPGIIIDYSNGYSVVENVKESEEPQENVVSSDEESKTVIPITESTEDTSNQVSRSTTDSSSKSNTTANTTTKKKTSTGGSYVLNTNTKKFHYPNCKSVSQMKEKNKEYSSQSRDEIIARGYSPCKNCNP